MIRQTTMALLFLLAPAIPAWGLDYYLQQDLGVQGLFHLCRYSNGKVYSFNATTLCPLQVQDNGPPAFAGSPPQRVGFKAGEYMDGMTKVCVYNVLGDSQAIRIGAVELCPLTHNF
jgi:hypothetical protein